MITFDSWLAEQCDRIRTVHVAPGEYSVFRHPRKSYDAGHSVFTVAEKTKHTPHPIATVRNRGGVVEIALDCDGALCLFVPHWRRDTLAVRRVVPGHWINDEAAAERALAVLKRAAETVYERHVSTALGAPDEDDLMRRLARHREEPKDLEAALRLSTGGKAA